MSDFDAEEDIEIGEYEGERDDAGQRSGLGHNKFPNGDEYRGMYLHGMRNGKGRYTWKTGGIYEGEYLNHKRNGFGVMHYPDGSVYTGIWFDGWRHGKGTYVYPNGDSYEGDWQYGKTHGHGVYKCSKDGSVFDGDFRRGRRHGIIKWTLPNGLIFTGVFQNDQPLGRGKWEVERTQLAQHGEYAQLDGTIEEEEEDKADELSTDIQQSEDPETEHVVIINLDGDPFMFKSIEPLAFVPSVDDINLIGSDLFNGYEDEEVIYDEGMY